MGKKRKVRKMGETRPLGITKDKKGYGIYPTYRPKNPKQWKAQSPEEAKLLGEYVKVKRKKRAQKLVKKSKK